MKKTCFIAIIFFLGIYTSLMAQSPLDRQIATLQQASPAERVEIMNAIKIQLSTMNAQQRSAAINQLRRQRSSAHKDDKMAQNALQGSAKQHIPLKQQQQMNQMGSMGKNEQMNQRQGLDQFQQKHGPGQGGPPSGTKPHGNR